MRSRPQSCAATLARRMATRACVHVHHRLQRLCCVGFLCFLPVPCHLRHHPPPHAPLARARSVPKHYSGSCSRLTFLKRGCARCCSVLDPTGDRPSATFEPDAAPLLLCPSPTSSPPPSTEPQLQQHTTPVVTVPAANRSNLSPLPLSCAPLATGTAACRL